jgi:hypothetical protein
MVVIENNKPDPKQYVDELYNKIIRIHVLDPDYGYVTMTKHAAKDLMYITVREMEKTVIMFGGGYDVTYFNQVRAYIEAK